MADHCRKTARIAALLIALTLPAACGQKGGLVRPEAVTANEQSRPAGAVAGEAAANTSALVETAAVTSL